ncbi:hypothetical protein [Mannheimia pernigra]|uniref:Uncharacterized protein n=1 Tax=Mannheimia pernigra TaxID=111844 RepID=A0A7D5DZP2_9PAST|nr:hypothetical protein [Mannheimia pernigra]QLB39542.1 hypothetical protein HV559_00825 [Mannheimia pernigra]
MTFTLIANNKYTYDNYDRVATRSFDTDSKKEGFERVDTYHRDVYGRVVRQDKNFTGDELLINEYSTHKFDLYGREIVIRVFDSQGNLSKQNTVEYDVYGLRAKDTSYTNNTTSIFKRDEYGRIIVEGRDNNLDGELGAGDSWRAYTYNDQGRAYKVTDVNTRGVETNTIWNYDDFGRRDYTFVDSNGNEHWDNGETKHVDTYHITNSRDAVYRYVAPNEENPTNILKFVYLNAGNQGTQIGTLDSPLGKEFKTFNYNVFGSQATSVEDYTTENWHRFFDKVGGHIQVINMSDARAKTEITLDNDVLRKITTGSELRIAGDSTDVVNLKNSHEFKKLDETKKVSNQEYNQYTTQVDGHDYTLLIDTDITTNLLP